MSIENRFFHPPAFCDQSKSKQERASAYCYGIPMTITPVVLSILGILGTLSLQTFAIANISILGCTASGFAIVLCLVPDKQNAVVAFAPKLILLIGTIAVNTLGLCNILPAQVVAISTLSILGAGEVMSWFICPYVNPPKQVIVVEVESDNEESADVASDIDEE